MEKVLTTLGNSVALVIDQPLCRMLDIRRGSRVRVTSDGQRLVIEPLHEQPPQDPPKQQKPVEIELVRIVETLVCWHMTEEAIRSLHPGIPGQRLHAKVIGWAGGVGPASSDLDQQCARRFRTCFDKLRAGASWAAAVDAALKTD